jgi:hypothetical protein
MKRALIPAFLLLLGSTIFGATVLREPIASAARLAQSVVISNTPDQAVPVREQNKDGSGNIKVHEQGTANAAVTGYPVASRVQHNSYVGIPVGQDVSQLFDLMNVSTLVLNSVRGEAEFAFDQTGVGFKIIDSVPEGGTVTIPLNETVAVNKVFVHCSSSATTCDVNYNIIGS